MSKILVAKIHNCMLLFLEECITKNLKYYIKSMDILFLLIVIIGTVTYEIRFEALVFVPYMQTAVWFKLWPEK